MNRIQRILRRLHRNFYADDEFVHGITLVQRLCIWNNEDTLCLTKDGGRPSEVAIQVEASNHRKLLWSKAMVVSVTEKGETRFRQVCVNADE